MFILPIPGLEIAILALVAWLIAGRLRARAGVSPLLVLKKFRVNERAADGLFLDIEGRAPGLVSWLLTLVGLNPTTTLQLTATEIYFRTASLHGESHIVVPLKHVVRAQCMYSRPIICLILGALCVLVGIVVGVVVSSADDGDPAAGMGIMLVFLLIGGAFILVFFLRKKLEIRVATAGGTNLGLAFLRSVIENVSVDLPRSLQAISLIHQKSVEAQIHITNP